MKVGMKAVMKALSVYHLMTLLSTFIPQWRIF
jgi:hypothetical protein